MSVLYIVATPIGNLSDISFRAIEVLKSVHSIAAEDTRHSQQLLSHFDIQTPCFSLHDYNEDDRIEKILSLLHEGKSIALVSDAGTPLISDPGFRLVRAAREKNFKVIPIPGACALIAALVASGMPTDKFIFQGFLPSKTSALENQLATLKDETRTMIFYESVHRIVESLSAMKKIFGEERMVTVARELTKTFETIKQASLKELDAWILNDVNQQKGEFVIVVSGAVKNENDTGSEKISEVLKALLSEVSVKQAVSLACKITGESRKKVYALALLLNNSR